MFIVFIYLHYIFIRRAFYTLQGAPKNALLGCLGHTG